METKDFSVTETEEPYYISVLFTSGLGKVSTLIYWLTGRQYTHASIGLGKQTECFYSFDFRGFRTEHPSHRKLRNGKMDSFQLKKSARMYHPNNLAKTLSQQKNLYLVLVNEV